MQAPSIIQHDDQCFKSKNLNIILYFHILSEAIIKCFNILFLGYKTIVVLDATRPVNPVTGGKAVDTMEGIGNYIM